MAVLGVVSIIYGDVDEIIDDSKSKEIQEKCLKKICDEIKNLKDADIQKKLKTRKREKCF